MTRRVLVTARQPGVQPVLWRGDAWKPGVYPGRKFYYCVVAFMPGYPVMRLFGSAENRATWIAHRKKQGHKLVGWGRITYKEQPE